MKGEFPKAVKKATERQLRGKPEKDKAEKKKVKTESNKSVVLVEIEKVFGKISSMTNLVEIENRIQLYAGIFESEQNEQDRKIVVAIRQKLNNKEYRIRHAKNLGMKSLAVYDKRKSELKKELINYCFECLYMDFPDLRSG